MMRDIPSKGSIVKYLRGINSLNCKLIVGSEYEVLGNDSNATWGEYA